MTNIQNIIPAAIGYLSPDRKLIVAKCAFCAFHHEHDADIADTKPKRGDLLGTFKSLCRDGTRKPYRVEYEYWLPWQRFHAIKFNDAIRAKLYAEIELEQDRRRWGPIPRRSRPGQS